ncbi:ABC transporter permease [Marispirochaeta aestuarii]|uniref:ABC transporter permease n=1 Tax=Marispirochaeta aestuarii TaxID=1963862 RepID=UPI0029C9A4B7|nr:ABC transporter permease [Marispirochaeta aestuarii]
MIIRNFIRLILQSILVMLFVSLISFVLFRFVGDPVESMVGIQSTEEDREFLRDKLGLNDPFYVQFGHFVGNMVSGDFGISYSSQRPVKDLLIERLPATLELVFVSVILSLGIGIPLGVFTALRQKSALSKAILTLTLVGVSIPVFVIGILLIYLFSVILNILPSFGRGDLVHIGNWATGLLTVSGWRSIILPAVTLCIFQLTLIVRIIRSEMLEVLRTDFIKFGRARGLTDRSINYRHALRNTMVPVLTVIGLQIGTIIAFSIITETVFQWPGMGLLFIHAVQTSDIPIMAAYLVFVALLFVIINSIVDLLYLAVDPRLRTHRTVKLT